ncbi:MAG: glycosyltransferase family 9 protein [Candidatus Zixiibacteriota bacterium]|nr:MAG: glycosyltransferase family 9 protein [candidate division Zixibacteria bacterium]
MKNYLKPLEHKFKALFFSVFRSFLKKGRKDFRPLDGNSIRKVLFLRPEKIGDMVISLPVFDGLRRRFPHIKISILGSPTNQAIIKDDPRFDRIYIYRKNPISIIRVLMEMRRGQYDCVVDMICNDSVTALFLSQLCARGKPRIGVGKAKYRNYYDYNYDHRMGNTGHIIENTLKLLDAFGIDSSKVDCYAPPYIMPKSAQMAADYIARIVNSDRRHIKVGYNMSAGSPTRIWAEEKAIALLKRVIGYDPAVKVILFSTPAERSRAQQLREKVNPAIALVPDNLNLTEAAAIISHLDVLITPDTSLVHVARSFKVHVIGLYSRYMYNFLLWRPYGQDTGAVVSGCDDNIFDITVDQVYDTFVQVVQKQNGVKP